MSKPFMPRKVLVTGARGLVGSAICRELTRADIPHTGVTRDHGDLTNKEDTDRVLAADDYDCVVIAAARVGGIHANNTYPADFIHQNLMIETNLIDGAYKRGISRVIFLGSSCIYPREAAQPLEESSLLTGPLEQTNEAYAIAKIAGIKLCESYNRQFGTDYRSLMPTNLYGPGDNFHPEDSHVIPALMQRFHEAKTARLSKVTVWGSGNPRREFLHVDDLSSAVAYTLLLPADAYWSSVSSTCSHLNVGTGMDVSIRELASTMRDVVGLDAEIEFDADKPDGTPRKLLNVDKLAGLGWRSQIELEAGLSSTYEWYLENWSSARH